VSPEMNAVCSIMIGVVGIAVIAASLLTKRVVRQRGLDMDQ
jgi:ABC-type spermidine/putrescine transport system permease subunit II